MRIDTSILPYNNTILLFIFSQEIHCVITCNVCSPENRNFDAAPFRQSILTIEIKLFYFFTSEKNIGLLASAIRVPENQNTI